MPPSHSHVEQVVPAEHFEDEELHCLFLVDELVPDALPACLLLDRVLPCLYQELLHLERAVAVVRRDGPAAAQF
eukprot:4588132-Pleurochrysis_carterae.AAC.1